MPASPGPQTCEAAPADDGLADQREHRPGQPEEGEHGAEPVQRHARDAALARGNGDRRSAPA